jgi:glucokinase
MRLLAIDIGGTNSRFADCYYQSENDFNIKHTFNIKTKQACINSFQDLLNVYDSSKAELFLNHNKYDVISIAGAGPVNGNKCCLTNVSWNIDLDQHPTLPKTFLLNDFTAQAYAFSIPEELEKLEPIRINSNSNKETIAIIGAGTGLGHSLLMPSEACGSRYKVIPSEAGQACFTFYAKEKELESFILEKTGQDYAINDLVVSGTGISLIHEFISGQTLNPEVIFSNSTNHEQTLRLFSTFYARACRNFCLYAGIPDTLIITAGIAAKHPELINNELFINEFNDSKTHQSDLKETSIYLNSNEKTGLLGSFIYALRHI